MFSFLPSFLPSPSTGVIDHWYGVFIFIHMREDKGKGLFGMYGKMGMPGGGDGQALYFFWAYTFEAQYTLHDALVRSSGEG